MILKKKISSVFSLLLALDLLLFPHSETAAENQTLRDIAIADLANISGNADLDQYGQSIAETIFAELAFSQKLSLVERSRLKDAFKEIKRGELGVTDPSTAAKVGKIVGARHLFVGTLSEFKEERVIVINTRLIEVESGRAVSGWNERAPVNKLSQVPFDLAKKILGQLFPDPPAVAALKSTLLPGWGQLSNGRLSGYLALAGGLASIGGLAAMQASLSNAEDDRDKLTRTDTNSDAPISAEEHYRLIGAYNEAQQDVDKKRERRNTAAIVLGAVWGLNVLEAYIGEHLLVKSRQRAVQRALAFEASPNLRGIVMRVRF